MLRHFSTNLTNLRESRIHTLFTSSISHEDPFHLLSNLAALWLFGPKLAKSLSCFTSTRHIGACNHNKMRDLRIHTVLHL